MQVPGRRSVGVGACEPSRTVPGDRDAAAALRRSARPTILASDALRHSSVVDLMAGNGLIGYQLQDHAVDILNPLSCRQGVGMRRECAVDARPVARRPGGIAHSWLSVQAMNRGDERCDRLCDGHRWITVRSAVVAASQARSWKPERGRRRGERKRKLVFGWAGIGLIVAVAVYLLWPVPVPLTQFVAIVRTADGPDTAGFPGQPLEGAEANAERLLRLFTAMQDDNPELVADPVRLDSNAADPFASLDDTAGRRLIVYCGVDASLTPGESGERDLVLHLGPAGGRGRLTLTGLLEQLADLNGSSVLLLLECGGVEPGLNRGIPGKDLIPQISNTVSASSVPGLCVLCAFDDGERSWEFVSRTPESGGSAEEPAASGEPSPPEPPVQPLYTGTAFGHFLEQALLEGHFDSPADLQQFVSAGVRDWVSRQHGVRQTVLPVDRERDAWSSPLLARAVRPEAAAVSGESADSDASADTQAAADTTAATDDGGTNDGTNDGSPAESEPKTPARRLERLTAIRDQIAAGGLIPVTHPASWRQVQSLLLHARQSVLHGNERRFAVQHDDIEKRLLELQARQSATSPLSESEELRQWLAPMTAPSEETVAEYRAVWSELTTPPVEGVPAEPLSAERSSPEFIRGFTAWLLQDLTERVRELANLDLPARLERVAGWRRACRRLVTDAWPIEALPHQMVTLSEVFTASDDDERHLALMPAVLRLISLRDDALAIAAGTTGDGSPCRRENWRSLQDRIPPILTRLVAAESWLRLGRPGITPAQQELERAEQQLRQVRDALQQQETLQAIRDAQYRTLPFLMECLAAAQERVPLTDDERQAARDMAAAVTQGADPQPRFPRGLLNATGFQQAHLAAMFALTRNFDQQPVTDADRQHSTRLWDLVNRRATDDPVGWTRQRLLQIPGCAEYRGEAAVLDALGRPAAGPSNSNGPQNGNSGLWLSFWSIRLLAAQGTDSTVVASLWQDWSDLADQVDVTEETTESEAQQSRALLRARLFRRLNAQWSRITDERKAAEGQGSAFTRLDECIPLLLTHLNQWSRITQSPAVRSTRARLAAAAAVPASGADRGPAISLGREAVEIGPEGLAELSADIEGAGELYLAGDAFDVADRETLRRGSWFTLTSRDSGTADSPLRLRPRSTLTTPIPLRLLAVDADGIVTDTRDVMVHPSSESDWQIDFLRGDGQRLTTVVAARESATHSRYFLDLPGSSRDAASGKNIPYELQVRLRRTKGTAKTVQVQLFADGDGSAAKAVWPEPLERELDEATASVMLPLLPPSDPPVPAAEAPVVDLSQGFHFRIRIRPPEVLVEQEQTLQFEPRFYEPTQYVRVPEPQWDPAILQLTLPVERSDAIPSLRPPTVPLTVHLSPELESLLAEGGTTFPDLKDGMSQTFRFSFTDRLRQALRDGNPLLSGGVGSVPTAGMEFSLSVAGIPHVWRWKLDSNGVRLLDEEIRPTVRPLLQLVNPDNVTPWAIHPELQLRADWSQARFQVAAPIHGGRLDREDGRMLRIVLRPFGDAGGNILYESDILTDRYRKEVTASPGENGIWSFSTRTDLHRTEEFGLQSFGLADGQYEVVAMLSSSVPGEEPVQRAVRFLADGTPPVFFDDGVRFARREGTPVTQPLEGTILVDDPESAVVGIRVGLAPDKLTPLRDLSGDRRYAFRIPPLEFPEIPQLETANPRRVSVHVEVTNGVGLVTPKTFPAILIRPGKPSDTPMTEEPGGLTVTINSASTYQVTVSGPKTETKTGTRMIAFSELPPGDYKVAWHVENRPTYGAGGAEVTIRSGKVAKITAK